MEHRFLVLRDTIRVTEVRSVSPTGGEKGVKEQRYDLIPVGPLAELAQHYGRGAKKYAPNQWRVGYEWSKSYAAGMRHMTLFWGGEDYDICPDDYAGCKTVDSDGNDFPRTQTENGFACYNHTGSHHLVCAAWNMMTLLEFKGRFPQYDDRYKSEVKK